MKNGSVIMKFIVCSLVDSFVKEVNVACVCI